jgi:hypothetical protein
MPHGLRRETEQPSANHVGRERIRAGNDDLVSAV